MMAGIINLNRVRKGREKTTAKAEAAVNRVAHGRSKAQREVAKAERERLERLLDQTRRED